MTRRRWATCQRYACTCSARDKNCPPRGCQEQEQWGTDNRSGGKSPVASVIRSLYMTGVRIYNHVSP